MTQDELHHTLEEYLKRKYSNIISTNDYIIAEGNIPVALVAHMDTVGTLPPENIFYDSKKKVMWSPELLGADDRAGIYAIINIIESGYLPRIIFTRDEEKGALGATALTLDERVCPFSSCNCIIQLDRRGDKDSVYYDCDNKEFTKYIDSFGFKEAYGTFSDISELAPAWGIAAVNLSVGYENEHTVAEYLKVKSLESTIEKVKRILDKANEMPAFAYVEKKYKYAKWSFNNDECIFCGRVHKDMIQNGYYKICRDCYREYWGMDAPIE